MEIEFYQMESEENSFFDVEEVLEEVPLQTQSDITFNTILMEEKLSIIADNSQRLSILLSSIYIIILFWIVIKFLNYVFAKLFFGGV